MSRKLVLVLLLAACAALIANEAADLKKHIQSEMNKYVAAGMKLDSKACEKLIRGNFAPDYKETQLDGSVLTLDQWMKEMKENLAMTKKMHAMKLTVHTVKVKGNKAVSTESGMMSATVMTDPKDSKKMGEMYWSGRWSTTLVKKDGKWWVKSGKVTSQKMTMDGKPFPPKKSKLKKGKGAG